MTVSEVHASYQGRLQGHLACPLFPFHLSAASVAQDHKGIFYLTPQKTSFSLMASKTAVV